MSRQILFRGKRIDNGEWIEGYYAKSGGCFVLKDNGLTYGGFEMFEVVPETVCQYTGLTDRNGRKIFDGDVIQFEKKKYSVVWNDRIASFVAKPFEEGRSWPCMNVGTMKAAEVIGNVFDNPELMEKPESEG